MYKEILLLIFLLPIQLLSAPNQSINDMSWMLFAAFAILINIIMIVLYYYNIAKLKNTHNIMLNKITDFESSHDSTKCVDCEVVDESAIAMGIDSFGNPKALSMGDLSATIVAENKLLNATESLIKFLRLKSKKIKIGHDEFNLNNVLNEVSGSLSNDFSGSNIELIFDVDNDIPKFLQGDPQHLEEILISLLMNTIQHNPNTEVSLNISKTNLPSGSELKFKIAGKGTTLSDDELHLLSTPHYDEKKEEYIGLDFFISNELVNMMNGNISIEGTSQIGTVFSLTLPLEESDYTVGREDRLPRKVMLNKKVLVVDNNYNSTVAIGNMLAYFNYDVDTISNVDFHKRNISLYPYDIVMFGDSVFRHYINEQIDKVREQKDLKVVRIGNMFSSSKFNSNNEIIDLVIYKPFSHERIYETIIELYEPKKKRTVTPNTHVMSEIGTFNKMTLSQKESFYEKENVTLDSFADFAGTRLLIVEDNRINQKILMNVLNKAKMDITIANNGKEAVDLVATSDKKFDFILMDINMPIMDGYDATSTIKNLDTNNEIPIVALTALVLDSEINKMFRHGVNGYLSKPLKIGKLYSAFEFFLDKVEGKENDLNKNNRDLIDNYDTDIDDMDIEKGLVNANGSDALYKEVLGEFISAYGDSDKLLYSLIEDKDYEKIKSLAIDMRGLTRTMGAYRMHDTAGRIYKLFLYGNLNMLNKHANEYERDLSSLKNSIYKYIQGDM